MHIDMQSLASGPTLFDLEISAEEIDLQSEGAHLTKAAIFKGEAKINDAGIAVTGYIRADLKIDCSRCLEPVGYSTNVQFVGRYVDPTQFGAGNEHELEADDLTVDVHENGSIDLVSVACEQIILNLPEQLYCREDCRGLCEKCGANSNLIDCKCLDEGIDPRWAALKNLN